MWRWWWEEFLGRWFMASSQRRHFVRNPWVMEIYDKSTREKTHGKKSTLFDTSSGNPATAWPGNSAALLRVASKVSKATKLALGPRRVMEGIGAEGPHLCWGRHGGGAATGGAKAPAAAHGALRPSLCLPYALRWGTTRLGSRRAYLRHAFATTFAMAAKFGVPRPVDASQPLIAAQPSVLPPTALVPCVTSLNMPGFW